MGAQHISLFDTKLEKNIDLFTINKYQKVNKYAVTVYLDTFNNIQRPLNMPVKGSMSQVCIGVAQVTEYQTRTKQVNQLTN